MCEEEYRAKMRFIFESVNIPGFDDIIENKVAECKGEALGSSLFLDDIFEREVENVAKNGKNKPFGCD